MIRRYVRLNRRRLEPLNSDELEKTDIYRLTLPIGQKIAQSIPLNPRCDFVKSEDSRFQSLFVVTQFENHPALDQWI